MSPKDTPPSRSLFGFPRVSGDESVNVDGCVVSPVFSPRERG